MRWKFVFLICLNFIWQNKKIKKLKDNSQMPTLTMRKFHYFHLLVSSICGGRFHSKGFMLWFHVTFIIFQKKKSKILLFMQLQLQLCIRQHVVNLIPTSLMYPDLQTDNVMCDWNEPKHFTPLQQRISMMMFTFATLKENVIMHHRVF